MDKGIGARAGEQTANRNWQEEADRTATFNCPRCGKQTPYEPFRCTSRGQREDHEGVPYWYLYVLVECQHCLHQEMVFWMRAQLNLP